MSELRLTGGRARGRVLRTPVSEGVRPTASRVREALFSIVGQDLAGERVLDAFGGSGLVALEAWSRGADVVVIERDGRVAAALRKRAAEIGASLEVVTGDAARVIATLGPFDGAFVDPPYGDDPGPALAALAGRVSRWIAVEAAASTAVPAEIGGLVAERPRPYGRTVLHVYR